MWYPYYPLFIELLRSMTTTAARLTCQLDNAFWRFSLNVYQHNLVKERILSFQHSYQMNGNVLLFCCWLAYAVNDVSQSELLAACHSLDDWQDNVTNSLRSIRSWIKSLPKSGAWINDFYQLVLMDEIVSETWQQHRLYSCVKNKQKEHPAINISQAVCYLNWIFTNQTIPITDSLAVEISHFVELIFSKISVDGQ